MITLRLLKYSTLLFQQKMLWQLQAHQFWLMNNKSKNKTCLPRVASIIFAGYLLIHWTFLFAWKRRMLLFSGNKKHVYLQMWKYLQANVFACTMSWKEHSPIATFPLQFFYRKITSPIKSYKRKITTPIISSQEMRI